MGVNAGLALLLAGVLLTQVLWVGRPTRWVGAARTPARWTFTRGRRALGLHPADEAPSRSGLVAAVVVGGVLRLLWVVWATRTPTDLRDPAEYLRIASDFGHGILPRFGGVEHSAYWPPGYSAILAPFVAVADRTGWLSPAFAASLVNLAAGTLTIALAAWLADQWLGPRARNLTAWLVALCPALIYWTATAHTETVFTPMLLGVIALSTRAVEDDSRRSWLLIGLLFGAAFLVRSPAVVVLVAPALCLRADRGSWQGAARATGLVLLAAMVLLVPWAIRNGVQVGVWSPASTNNAAAACFGNHDETEARWEPSELTPQLQDDCYGHGSPFADERLNPLYATSGVVVPADTPPPDEPAWYRYAMGRAIRWAVSHPVDEIRLAAGKVGVTWGAEGQVVDGARNYAEPGWAGTWQGFLGLLANLWTWIVGVLALLGLALVPACRRAAPIWAPIVLLTVAIVGGVAEPHYRYPVVPLVAVLAAGFLTRPRAAA